MTGRRVRPGDAGKLEPADDYTPRCKCGRSVNSKSWIFSTNGDGSAAQVCKFCGAVVPIGRFYVDQNVGVRFIALSTLSALVTLPAKKEDAA